jgi:pyridoxal 5'-phosphate synthase pdxS subunit
VPNFSAGGIATPADAALMMQLGAETVFVGSGIFMKDGATPLEVRAWTAENAEIGLCSKEAVGNPRNPEDHEEAVSRAKAIVIAATHYSDPKTVAEASEAITGTMKGLAAAAIEESQRMQTRGW